MDDSPNILNNYYLHPNSISFNTIINTFFTNPSNPYELNTKMYRPIPCLSFALNWYFDKNNVVGFHIVNITIHIITGFFIYLFTINLFKTPNLQNKNNYIVFIAILTSLLWSISPIQTQAVTYIVQRMAQMAAMFYIIAMYAYLKGRTTNIPNKKIIWFIGSFISFLLALGSKENAAMLPLSLMLIEITFFQNLTDKKTKSRLIVLVLLFSIIIFSVGIFVFFNGNPSSIIKAYNGRTFSLTERLFAQPRIVLYYISQIFYPLPYRFSIAHDVVLSKSIFTPWTTIPSIIAIFSLIGFALLKIRKYSLLSFSILFFFLNHVIESSIIPLELMFEHRNYLPSFFCFLPLALLIAHLLSLYRNNNRPIYISIIAFIIFLITFLCSATFIRNKVWKNDITLWSDAAVKAPNNARAHSTLAIKLAWGNNSVHPKRYDMAIKLFENSLKMHIPSKSLKAEIIGNIANVYSNNKHNYSKAITLYKKALTINPGNLKIRKDFVMTLVLNNNMSEALKNINILIIKNNKNEIYHNLRGFILLWQNEYEEALLSFNKAYEIAPPESNLLLNAGVALCLKGEYIKANFFLLKTIESSPNDMIIYLYLIDNSLRAGKENDAKKYTKKLIESFDTNTILEKLNSNEKNFTHPPLSKILISPYIKQQLNIDKQNEHQNNTNKKNQTSPS